MRTILLLVSSLIVLSCQKEELTVVDTQDQESILADGQLTDLIQSVASHDGSYDDVIDSSPCFSIDFPYDVVYDGSVYTIGSIKDLSIFNQGDKIVPVFPIDITSASYMESRISGPSQFQEFINRCANGSMYNNRITCVDFVYPVRISVFEPGTSNFEVITLEHDKQTFLTMLDMEPDVIARIRYPLQLKMLDGTRLDINDNEDLKATIQAMIPLCD